MRTLYPLWLGRRRYEPVRALQHALQEARLEGRSRDLVLLLEHEPVVTLGRGAHDENVLFSPDALARRGIDRVVTERGGDVTFHGPGQLVGYPIVDLAPDRCDVRRYVRDLAATMVRLAAEHGVSAGTLDGAAYIGTWVDRASPDAWPTDTPPASPAKLGAIGVRLSRWVTMHGFAFNGSTDLADFSGLIVPCGIRGAYGVTSLQDLLGSSPSVRTLGERAARHLAAVLDADLGPSEDLSGVDDDELAPAILG